MEIIAFISRGEGKATLSQVLTIELVKQ